VLRARIEGGRAAVGAHPLMVPEGAQDGSTLHAFVRPHEVQIARAGEGAEPVALAVVEELTRVGGFVKIGLRLASGERLTIRMAKGGFDGLALEEGERVQIDLKGAKVFVEEPQSLT
jgi:sulfate transport system ATP-binding protein